MQSVSKTNDVQLPKAVVHRRVCKYKNCQAGISYQKPKKCEHDDFESQSTVRMCSDKNCQDIINKWSVMPEMNMQLSKPAIRRLCNDKNHQSTRCYMKRNYDKNCQSV